MTSLQLIPHMNMNASLLENLLVKILLKNHKKWAEQVVKKGGSARQMVQPFDPEEALQGYGIRNTTPKKKKAKGIWTSGNFSKSLRSK